MFSGRRLLLLLGLFLLAGARLGARPLSADPATTRLLVGFTPGVSAAHASQLARAHGCLDEGEITPLNVRVLRVAASAAPQVLEALARRADVEFVEQDELLAPQAVPNDPDYSKEWHLPAINAPAAWDLTKGSSQVVIAVLDSGVNGSHPDLAGKLVPGWNFVENNANTQDLYGHGTAVAGLAGAATNNGAGVAALSWNCQLMPVRIADAAGGTSFSLLAQGLTWAADHGARVANVSFKCSGSSAVIAAAQYFQSKGGVVVSAAGNDGVVDPTPDNPYILTVGAIDSSSKIASFSTQGSMIDLVAPGVTIRTTRVDGTYSSYTGTSYSTPQVAGAAALIKAACPTLDPQGVQDVLKKSARDLGAYSWDSAYGWGCLDVAAALQLALGSTPDIAAPTVSISAPASGSVVSGTVTVQVAAADDRSVASVTVQVDSTVLGTRSALPYSFSWNTTQVPDGNHALTAIAVDGAGNRAAYQLVVKVNNADTTAPTVSFIAPAGGATVAGVTQVQLAASDDRGVASVTVQLDGAPLSTLSAAPYTVAWDTTQTTDGSHTLTATAVDGAGNRASTQITVKVLNADLSPPTVSFTAPGNGATVSGATPIQVAAADDRGVASVTVQVDGTALATFAGAPYALSWNTTQVANGSHTLTAIAVDTAGNRATVAITVKVSNGDTTPPTITITTPSAGVRVTGNTSIKVNASDNVAVVKVELYLDGVLVDTSTTAPFSFSCNFAKISAGSHTLQCRAYDAAKNVGISPTVSILRN